MICIYSCTSYDKGSSIIYKDDLSVQDDGVIHHFEELRNKLLLESDEEYINQKDFSGLIKMYETYECKGLGCFNKYCAVTWVYLKKGDYEKAKEYGQKAMSQGLDITMFDTVKMYQPILNDLYEVKEVLEKEYKGQFDLELRALINSMIEQDQSVRQTAIEDKEKWIKNLVYTDSLVQTKLDSLVDLKGGWISQAMIGDWSFGHNPSVIVCHMKEEKKKEYLELMKTSCLKGEEDWIVAEGMIFQLMLRNRIDETNFGFFNVDDVYLNYEGNILPNRSSFMITGIEKALRDNPQFSITIYPTDNIPNELMDNALSSFKAALMEKGLSEQRITINKELFEDDTHEYDNTTAFVIWVQKI